MRTRLLVPFAALAAALLPATAQAGTISVTTPYASPVELTWVVTATGSETLYRANGACAALPIPGAAIVASDFTQPPTLNSFSDTPGDGTFCYYVEDDAGLAYSNALQVPVDATPPVAPPQPTGATPVSAAPAIAFAGSTDTVVNGVASGVDHYDVYRDGVKVNASAIPDAGPGPYAWSDVAGQSSSPVSGSGTYAYTVVAVDVAGNGSLHSTGRSIVLDQGAPNAPAAPTGASPVAGAPAIAFAASTDPVVGGVSSGVDHYDVYRAGVKVNSAPITGAGPFTWSDVAGQSSAPVSGSGSYSYRVVAVDAVGNESAQSAARVIVLDTAAPDAPPAPGGTTPVSSAPAITFSASADPVTGGVASGVDHYNVYRGGVKVNSAPITGAGPYAWSDVAGQSSNPASGSHNYSYTVRAVDAAGNASVDSPARAILLDSTAPTAIAAAPTGLTSVSAAPTITFDGTTDPLVNGVASLVNHYDIHRNGTKVNAAPIPHTGAQSYTWSDAGAASLTPPTGPASWSYTVRAVDFAGNISTASPPLAIFLDPSAASAPSSMAALATPTTQRPEISWVAPAAPGFTVHHYKVYRGGSWVQDVSGSTTFTDNGVGLADGSYTYQVVAAALGDATLGIASAPVTILYDRTAPAVPGAVSAAAALDGSVGISWAAAGDGTGSGVTRYVVRRSPSSSAPVSAADGDATCQGLFTSCADATTLNGKLYSYSVFAVDAVGNTSAAGSSVAVTARDQLAPAAPKGLAATPADAGVDLRWSAAGADEDVAGYVLVAKQGASAPASEADGTRICTAVVAGSTACSVTGLTNGATYTFGLFALDEALNRSPAAVAGAAPNGKVPDAKAPAAVTKLKATVSGRTVKLTWKNPVDRDFDHVVITAAERKTAALAAAKRVYTGKGTRATTKLAAGQSRWFTVVAYDAAGNASPAARVRVTVAAPSRFGPEPRAKVHGKVRLSWPVVKGARYYNVQVYAGKQRILVGWPVAGKLQLPQAKLKRGKTYTWYVWPGLGAKAKARYGKLIGKNTFTFMG